MLDNDKVDFNEHLVTINRVAKVVKGGRRFGFAAIMIVGDNKGRVGIGTGKAKEVPEAVRKATENAKNKMIRVHLKENRTIHHDIVGRFGAGKVILRSASPGTGIIAGGPMRALFESLGIKDVEHFEVAAKFIDRLVQTEIHKCIPKGTLLNVNVPNIPEEEISGVKMAFTGFQQYSEDVVEREDTRGRKYYWVGGTYQGPKMIEGSDGEAIKNNFISVDLQVLHPYEKVDVTKIEEIVKGLNA